MFKSNENKIWLVVVVAIIGCFAVGDTALAQEKTNLSIPAAVGYGKSAIARQAKTCSVSRSSKTAQRPVAQTVALAGAKKSLKRIKPNRQVRRTAKFVEVEILLTDQFSLEDISALPRAPGSDLEVLDGPKRVIVQLSASEVKALVDEGAEVTVQRKFVLVEGFVDEASSQDDDITVLQTCSGDYCYGSNSDNRFIPDDGPYGAWAYSDITISCAPPGEPVTCIDVHYEIIHTYVGDLYVDLTDYDQTDAYVLWLYEGGSADNINETETGITTFNGKMVNQIWLLWATDDYLGDTGYIDYWWIKVYYDGEDYDYYIQADSYCENTVEVWFEFSSNPGTVCFSVSPDCGSLDPNCDDPNYDPISGYWGVSTKYNPCEDECSSVTITADPTVGSDQTKTVHLDDRYHIGCGSLKELGVSTWDPNTDEPAQAWVTCIVIPPEAGTCPCSGDSEYNPLSGLYEFWCTYTPNCDYAGRVRVKFLIDNPSPYEDSIIIYSFDQNSKILIPCSNLQTVCESFCTEGFDLNYYQVYKMYLYASENYDFSLCDNDGVGASCDGDGDLEMFDSSGMSLWYIDGASSCGYDASTLGTLYEAWSPTSDGYYYLKVSEYYAEPMSYCLAYWGSISPPPVGEFNGSCTVNFADFAILANQWLQPPGIPSADIAPEVPDGFVDMLDLAVFVENWLEVAAP